MSTIVQKSNISISLNSLFYSDTGTGTGCVGSASTFSSGYGGCSTYAASMGNHPYCKSDHCKITGLLASQVCKECGICGRRNTSKLVIIILFHIVYHK